jgi:hypothetical protein
MTALQQRLNASDVFSDNLLLSPDGRYLLAFGTKSLGANRKKIVNTLYTLEGQEVSETGASPFVGLWMTTNWCYAAFHTSGDTAIGSLHTLKPDGVVRLPPFSIPGGVFAAKNNYTYISQAGDTLLVCNVPQNGAAEECRLTRLKIGKTVEILSSVRARVPSGAHIDHAVLSPKGDYIAWSLRCHATPPFSTFLQSKFHLKAFAPYDYMALYLSRADGSEMRLLGTLPSKQEKSRRVNFLGFWVGRWRPWSEHDLQNLDWTPDGKKISFTYENRLYTLPLP